MDNFYETTSKKIRITSFKKIDKLLQTIYKEDPQSVLYGYLHHSIEGGKMLEQFFQGFDEKDQNITKEMRKYLYSIEANKKEYNKIKDIFIQVLFKSNFTREETKNVLDIKLSTDKWKRIRTKKLLKKRGRPSFDNKTLSDQLMKWSEQVDDSVLRKTVQTIGKKIQGKYSYVKEEKLAVSCCFKCLHRTFISDLFNSEYSKISYRTFLNKIPNNIILPTKKTDLCELCLMVKKVLNKREKNEEQKNLILIYENHKENALSQRNSMKLNIENLTTDQGIMIMDFKQNIKLGGSPEEISRDYYHTTSINYLSFFIKTSNTGYFFDFTSTDLSKDAYFVIECMKLLFTHEKFKELKIKELIVWSDVGKHFRNSMIAYFFANLPSTYHMKVIHNLFVECHGKNIVDVHFSQVNYFLIIKSNWKCKRGTYYLQIS